MLVFLLSFEWPKHHNGSKYFTTTIESTQCAAHRSFSIKSLFELHYKAFWALKSKDGREKRKQNEKNQWEKSIWVPKGCSCLVCHLTKPRHTCTNTQFNFSFIVRFYFYWKKFIHFFSAGRCSIVRNEWCGHSKLNTNCCRCSAMHPTKERRLWEAEWSG